MQKTHKQSFCVQAEQINLTLAALLRVWLPGRSWSQVRQLVATRRVWVNGELWQDPARRLKPGDVVEVHAQSAPLPSEQSIVSLARQIRHLDEHIVVVEKPSGLNTVRHPAELNWSEDRKALSPTLHDLIQPAIASLLGSRTGPRRLPRLRIVHRLDKETSGLVVFARSIEAERSLGRQFHRHSVHRRYLALVPGMMTPQRIHTWLVRDRGDGRRGNSLVPGVGKEAITHIEGVEHLPGYTLVACRLETGRTHQIRIHLAELGHPVCGDKVYNRRRDGSVFPDASGAPRLALHASELGFRHPTTGAEMKWEMPLPADLQALLESMRKSPQRHKEAAPRPSA